MSTVLTIAEFNPLHFGHAHFMQRVRETYPNALMVCLMSGNFVQRGTPAVADRWTRAGMALAAGADVVLELPALFAIQGAAGFARGAVRLASALGAETLAFGTESGTLESLQDAARLLSEEPPQLAASIRSGRRAGLNHGAAQQQALRAVDPDLAALLNSPNNILAIEYLQALRGTDMRPFMVRRSGIGGRSPSAHAVRHALKTAPDAEAVLREWGVPILFEPQFLEEELYRLGLYRLRFTHPDALLQTTDISQAVAARLLGAAGAADYTQFQEAASTRWLSRSRVRRALLNLVLGFSRSRLADVSRPDSPLHTRLLGLRTEAEPAFGRFASRSRALIVSGAGQYPGSVLADGDQRAAELYGLLKTPPGDPAGDKAHRVVKLHRGRLHDLPGAALVTGSQGN